MPCGWNGVTPTANAWTGQPATANTWTADGETANVWRPDPYVLMLDDGGFLQLSGCGRLQLEALNG